MSSAKRTIPLIILALTMLGIGTLLGWLIARAPAVHNDPITESRDATYTGVYLSVDIPEHITATQPYDIRLDVEELDGKPRTIIGIRVTGFMLTRALQHMSTEPTESKTTSNIGQGWSYSTVSIPLKPYERTTISIHGAGGGSGAAHGLVTVIFEGGGEVVVPVKFEIAPQ